MPEPIRVVLFAVMVLCGVINLIVAHRGQEKRLRLIGVALAVACLGNATYWGWGLWR